jgi:hypothetical protein
MAKLPLFKFRSMSGAILFRSGGSITWKADRQERTSLSSCEAEIRATNMGSRLTVNTRNLILDLSSRGYPITDAATATPVFNDNNACVQWCHNLTTKGNQHIEHSKNVTKEWVADGSITVSHISGKCNPANIFTKEMRDAANFRCLRDAFMCRASDFLKDIFTCISDSACVPPICVAQAAQRVCLDYPGTLEVILSHSAFRTSAAISCLSHAGKHILSKAGLPLRACPQASIVST